MVIKMKKSFLAILILLSITAVPAVCAADTEINGVPHGIVATLLATADFDDVSLPAGLNGSANYGWHNFGDEHKNVLKLEGAGGQNSTARLLQRKVSAGIVALDFDVRYNIIKEREQIFQFNTYNADGKDEWNVPICQFGMTNDGYIRFVDMFGASNSLGTPLEADTWYHFRLLCDADRKTFSFFIDDEMLLYDAPMRDQAFTAFNVINIRDYWRTGEDVLITYLDNISILLLARQFTADGEDCGDGSVSVIFSERMNSETLDGVKLYGLFGELVSCSTEYVGDALYMKSQTALKPNTEYTVEISETVRSTAGFGHGEALSIKLLTNKQPFGIEAALADSALIKATVRNETGENKTAVIIAAAYKGGALVGMSNAAVSGAARLSDYTLDVETSSYDTVKVYLVNGINARRIIDMKEAI